MPAPSKERSEDAMVVEPEHGVLAVLDGVGGWASVPGANPAEFAARLADALRAAAAAGAAADADADADAAAADAHRVVDLADAAVASLDKSTIMLGSSTMNVARIGRGASPELHIYNLGDSQARVLARTGDDGYAIVASTENGPSSQIVFNMPYQVGRNGNAVDDGSLFSVPVARGDVVLLTSDGIHDNLFNNQIVAVVDSLLGAASGPLQDLPHDELSTLLDAAAARLIIDARFHAERDAPTPFSPHGGKPDDSTAVVAVVV
ncbi:uncharacterized protein AMSG_03078 [Thecamonas trahens ATCC 50062]|uniref:Protein phosphatase n=1 Tax=Thecamonas trahens ATCC 50062 TaxID=461836 RepID=A0A0L0D392_THETB|nr:hypothetical protein AMSG_03078 [Thecamonas trahens ATCC 50062]KNC46641.1 hypothetical protein AMSG_03078 [Thecamonas trahens ATCC 50062]|eukprot:XP_013760414.1 hypothetical protein AMSG_03078 [Thecamonas trahens ATCC 50062]